MTDWYEVYPLSVPSMEVDDVRFAQPVGFVWFSRPRYRVKAVGRRGK